MSITQQVNEPLSAAEMEQAARLCDAAPKGPWEWVHGGIYAGTGEPVTLFNQHAAAFIAAARTLLPRALATIQQLTARAEAAEAERDAAKAREYAIDVAAAEEIALLKSAAEYYKSNRDAATHAANAITAELADAQKRIAELETQLDVCREFHHG